MPVQVTPVQLVVAVPKALPVHIAVLVGLARVAAHVHHLGDVLGGSLIGAACAVAGITAATAWRARARGTVDA